MKTMVPRPNLLIAPMVKKHSVPDNIGLVNLSHVMWEQNFDA